MEKRDQNNQATALACPLFDGISAENFWALSDCLGIRKKVYQASDYIVFAGEQLQNIGVMLEGRAHIIQEDFWGNRSLIGQVTAGDVFAEAFVCAGEAAVPVSVVAASKCAALMVDFNRIVSSCSNSCPFHQKLIRNMLGIVARRSVALTQKLEDVSQRTTRDKLLSYLSRQAKTRGSRFTIPFNRQELADYLGVDRSALSTVLATLAAEGVLSYHKSDFQLL